ncbi:hypothetical protein FZB88_04120 [Enterococcus faecium]|uniref:hypothetical protein n=1 Tax=Enterococcus faecium TaxID=1352 RepID=UPI000762E334|nr:hypothetical protein [Enterococcus faecium]ELI7091808.1 hypothetical protein [Enterococcus faecium]KWW23249.1 hypothetical protein AS179_05270 [Enterococcus faecium]KWY37234.1 hypothetical protein AS235_00185 [Enterococcus faecium]KWZ00887.1 hypothetical protein AS258_10170 [Enterococcus faecium]MCU2075531.1 hypothetical protein [Enterococcus faecium]
MFILDDEINKVKNPRIVPLLEEVRSSFYQGNYRSAIAVNYSALVLDLIDKLSDLANIYEDDTSKKILEEIAKLRKSDPNSPRWEMELLEKTYNSTELIDSYEYEDLKYIKDQRNYSAHPVVTYNGDTWELREITKETCQDVIRKSYEIVFLKNPILGKKVTNEIIQYASRIHSMSVTPEEFHSALKNSYLKKLSEKAKENLCKTAFKFVFKLPYGNEEVDRDRVSTFRLLDALIFDNKEFYLKILKKEISNYRFTAESREEINKSLGENQQITYTKGFFLLSFIASHPELQRDFSEEIIQNLKISIKDFEPKQPITTHIEDYYRLRSLAVLGNTKEELQEHLNRLLDPILQQNMRVSSLATSTLETIYNQYLYFGEKEMFLDFMIEHLTDSPAFRFSDKDMEILPWIYDKINQDQFNKLLYNLNRNNQFYYNGYFSSFISNLLDFYKQKFHMDLRTHYNGLLYPNAVTMDQKFQLKDKELKKLYELAESKSDTYPEIINDLKLNLVNKSEQYLGEKINSEEKLLDYIKQIK